MRAPDGYPDGKKGLPAKHFKALRQEPVENADYNADTYTGERLFAGMSLASDNPWHCKENESQAGKGMA